MNEIDKVLLKLHYRARKEAIKELLKEHKNNPKIVKKLKKLQETEPTIA